MDLRELFRVIRRWFWILILLGISGGSAGYIYSSWQQPIYQSTAEVFISQPQRDQLTDLGYINAWQLVQTYAELMASEQVLDETARRVNYYIHPSQISIQQVRDTQILEITVEDPDPVKASEYANMLVQVFSEQQYQAQTVRYAESKQSLEENLAEQRAVIDETITRLSEIPDTEENRVEREWLNLVLMQANDNYSNLLNNYESLRLEEAQSVSTVQLVEAAKPNLTPVRPNILVTTILGAVLGVLLAGGGVTLAEYLDDTVRSPDELTKPYDLSILAYIPKIPKNGQTRGGSGIYTLAHPRSPVAEAFRSLRTNIEFAGVVKPVKTILVTSPGPNEGKGTVATNLASIIAQGGKRAIVVDCDLRRPRVHKYFGLKNRRGLSDVFRDQANLETVLERRYKTLYVVTSGPLPPNPSELLGSDLMDQIISDLSNMADVVILDSPPMIVTDPILLSTKVDGVVLVVNPGTTKKDILKLAMTQLEKASPRILGVVLNEIGKSSSYYYYPQQYYQLGNKKS